MNRKDITQGLIDAGAIAVVRIQDVSRLIPAIEAVVSGGIYAIEITMTIPNAIEQIAVVRKALGDAVLVGVGSVLDTATARRALDAGARYLVSPIFKQELIALAHEYDVPAVPGCFSPTEIAAAHEAEADIVKIFPADVLGMQFFEAILSPLPALKLMPTGGVTLTNAGDWLKAGACAVGVGTSLLDKSAIAAGKFDIITENARVLRKSIDSARSTRV